MSQDELLAKALKIAGDRTSGASELLLEAVTLLRQTLSRGIDPRPVGRVLVGAQPSMAPFWTLVGHAIASANAPSDFDHYVAQLERAPRTLARHAISVLLTDEGSSPLHFVTLSFSGTVLMTLQEVARRRELQVSCGEGRPALEGRRLAERLSAAGVPVTIYADGALGQAIDTADAVLVGADAVVPEWFLNKSGTRMLAAAAAQRGLPLYVCATRDKFLSSAIAARLTIRDEPAAEIWSSPPPGVSVRNRYFERTPLDLVTAVISDVGTLGAALVPDACPTLHDALLLDL
jgi:translation initiation factor 2B subunit (eIF-2B alpha/beta/delta family)